MAQTATEQADNEVESQVEDCYYHIDADAFEAAGASLDFMIWQRLCWEGSCRFCKDATGPKPVLPMKTRNPNSIYVAIRKCATQDNYFLASMTVSEVVFRILLANGNKPMRFLEIIDQLYEAWFDVQALKSMAPDTVQKMLDGDNEYRIRRTEAPQE